MNSKPVSSLPPWPLYHETLELELWEVGNGYVGAEELSLGPQQGQH